MSVGRGHPARVILLFYPRGGAAPLRGPRGHGELLKLLRVLVLGPDGPGRALTEDGPTLRLPYSDGDMFHPSVLGEPKRQGMQ